ncbi:E3 ubiquitin-protein ligase dbl4 [Hondaea fermentalgiana]|uniref:RBR-type E3 ubiquitin transferase n=1 Tax=Hondaea fermentalgiana TaxID=2315210 RepID=A0A2R5GDD1_9STRA|nr:E3 ubiquitin-protein ligase dbl4 [Hondaea fermentalgiana]|eukprot:GBG26191.1 E3 ubiquitin-protein ligase dbl4 [Hondaea fermentalgiana]
MDSDEEYYYYSDEDQYIDEDDGSGMKPEGQRGDSSSSSAHADESKEATAGYSRMSVDEENKNSENLLPGSSNSGRSEGSATTSDKVRTAAAQQDEYTVMTPAMLRAEQEKLIKNVSDVLDTSYDISNVLLLHFKWNKERLFDAYYADPEKACRDAGAVPLVENARVGTDADAAGGSKEQGVFMCQILYMEVPYKYTFSLGCSGEDGTEHRFSLDAWQKYLCTKVGEGKDCIFTRCPADKCQAMVSPKVWEDILTRELDEPLDEKTRQRHAETLRVYQRHLATSFVDINRNIRWCPGKHCECAVLASGAVKEVRCTGCDQLFCFKCGADAHAPVSCKGLAAWQEKCLNESETANWILAHTKVCPKCSTRIEKNQGCNHMTCRMCRHDFCWICLQPWSEHGTTTGGYYNCNKFEGGTSDGNEDTAARAKKELDRYLHYYKRFATHQQAGKFATEQRKQAEQRMIDMQSKDQEQSWVDVQFLQQAVEQLIECRRVLMYTYAFAYFLPDGAKKELFEYNQSMLERNTEHLSELSELELGMMNRSEVINYTRVTGKFLRSLLEQVESEGLSMELPRDGTAPSSSSSSSSSSSLSAGANAKRAGSGALSAGKNQARSGTTSSGSRPSRTTSRRR